MAKRKKAPTSSSLSKKKSIATPGKKTQPKVSPKKIQPELDVKKVKVISNKINKINKNFECLIKDCKNALMQLSENKLSTI